LSSLNKYCYYKETWGKYFDCVSRISEELIEEYEEKTHKVVAYMTPPELVGAMALFGAIIGCTKYEDEII